MQTSSFERMLKEYAIPALEPEDEAGRAVMLSKFSHSVIFEAEFTEYDNLEKWIRENISPGHVNYLFYGKTDYDYGFYEVFLDDAEQVTRLADIIPTIYTTYPNGETLRTAGIGNFVGRE